VSKRTTPAGSSQKRAEQHSVRKVAIPHIPEREQSGVLSFDSLVDLARAPFVDDEPRLRPLARLLDRMAAT